MKLGGLSLSRAGHARKFFVETKIVLQRDSRQRLILFLDLDALFGFDRLMKPVRPATTFHQAPREVVNDDDLAVLNDVLMVELVERMSFESLLDAVQQFHVRRVVEIADA